MGKYYLRLGEETGIVEAPSQDDAIIAYLHRLLAASPRTVVSSVIGVSERGFTKMKLVSIGPYLNWRGRQPRAN